MNRIFYVPSGRIPLPIVQTTLWCLAVISPLAWLYAWLALNVPFLVARLVFGVGFAFVLGLAAVCVAARAKVQHPNAMALVGLGIGAWAWYFQWVAILHTLLAGSDWTILKLLLAPNAMFELACALAERGPWTVGGTPLPASQFAIIWSMELFLLAFVPAILGRARAADPFSEQSQDWAKPIELTQQFAALPDADAALRELESFPHQLLSSLLAPPLRDAGKHARVSLYRIDDTGPVYISVTNCEKIVCAGTERLRRVIVIRYLEFSALAADTLEQHQKNIVDSEADATFQLPPRELRDAFNKLRSGEYESAFAAASPFLSSTDEALRRGASFVATTALAEAKNWTEFLAFSQKCYDRDNTAVLALNVAIGFVMNDDLQSGQLWLAKAQSIDESTIEMSDVEMLTDFVSALTRRGMLTEALPYLEELRGLYEIQKIADPTLQHLRCMPFLDLFLENSVAVIRTVLGAERGREWYESMLPRLDADGSAQLKEWLAQQFGAVESSQRVP
jgi:hypothetical protein